MSQDIKKKGFFQKNRNTQKFSTKFLLIQDKNKTLKKPIVSNKEADTFSTTLH
jgi:hypothetical protein